MAAHYDIHDKNRQFYLSVVKQMISEDDAMDQLIEECSELVQALCKLRRAVNGTNPTPVTRDQAIGNVEEEWGDVLNAIEVLGIEPDRLQQEEKMLRWAQRLMKRGGTDDGS